MVEAQEMWDRGEITRLLDRLDGQRPERTDGEDLRGMEWYYLWHLAHQSVLTLNGHQGPAFSVAFSPDGSRLATSAMDGITIRDAKAGRAVLVLNRRLMPILSVAFSPTGSAIPTRHGSSSTAYGNSLLNRAGWAIKKSRISCMKRRHCSSRRRSPRIKEHATNSDWLGQWFKRLR
ncbi:MAG TPA: hypothetical protein VFA18_14120 [Gemmataceae bacterium]|nr:hypothetical protein [Gemmataceae bacterium]